MAKKKFIKLGGSQNPVAYCAYHKMTLSVNQMKAKECLSKNCNRLVRKEHDYWIQYDKQIEKKKQIKELKKMKEKKEKEKELRNDIMKRVKYCHEAPIKYKEQLDYCSQCPYGEGCMTEIIEMVHDYFNRF